jgi:aminopeptidase
MEDPRVGNLAKVLVEYSVAVKKGDLFLIEGTDLAAPLIRALYREGLRAGAFVTTRVGVEGIAEIFFREASEEQLTHVSEFRKFDIEHATALVSLMGGYNTKNLTRVDSQRQAMTQKANFEISRTFIERSARGELRWCGTMWPNHANAQDAEMSLSEYEDFVFAACFVDKPDPVSEWRRVSGDQERIVQFLSRKKAIRVEGKDTDLTVNVTGRTWINCDGGKNMPDGEIFTGPIENSAQGHIRYSYPAIYAGKEVVDVRLVFDQGRVVKAAAEKGQELLDSMIEMDEGARRIGEFAIGTNYGIQRFTKNTLFDEKIGGTVHIALGFSIPESGGLNQSGIHWDMVCDLKEGGRIYADGEKFYEDGKFLI